MLSVQQCATLACLLDVTTPKPGNVHRGADFEDMTFLDFVNSAVAVGPAFADAGEQRVGQTVLAAIRATREVTNANTNLGIVLLFAPLAKAHALSCERTGDHTITVDVMVELLAQLSPEDAADTYEAIRIAKPGGMGEVNEMDVNASGPPNDLMSAMRSAQDRDSIAAEYVQGFPIIVQQIVPRLELSVRELGIVPGILDTYLWVLSKNVDSLIRRKCGDEIAETATLMASNALGIVDRAGEDFQNSLAALDFWLRSDGNRRNPGTTADLVTAAIFVCLLERRVKLVGKLGHLR